MKQQYLVIAARLVLGLTFTAAGLYGLVFSPPAPPQMPVLARAFLGAAQQSHYAAFINAVQAVTGLLLVANRYVPLALVTMAAVLANILVFHLTMMPSGIIFGLILTGCWIVVAWSRRATLLPLLRPRDESALGRVRVAEAQADILDRV